MIFVTVGTHEQPFNRLLMQIDLLKKEGVIQENVVIQAGFSTYEPKYCKWSKLLSYKEMVENVEKAHIIITHGGPASFIMPLQIGKIPIVVPRQYIYGEHINNHQMEFVQTITERWGVLLPVYDICKLESVIIDYDSCVEKISNALENHNAQFNQGFEKMMNEMTGDSGQ